MHGGLRQDAVAKIENMRPSAKSRENSAHPCLKCRAAGGECQRIEIALQHQPMIESLRGPAWINGAVKPERIDAGARREIQQMSPGPFWKAYHAGILVAKPQARNDCLDRGKTPAQVSKICTASTPASICQAR